MIAPHFVAQRAGLALVGLALLAAVGAPILSPHAADTHFDGLLNAPPTAIHVVDDQTGRGVPLVERLTDLARA